MESLESRLSEIVNGWDAPVSRMPIIVHDPEPAKFDRAEHCRRIGQSGGFATSMIYGSDHMSRIGKIGYAVAVQKHGKPRMQEILKGKGWTRSQVSSFREDMAAVGL